MKIISYKENNNDREKFLQQIETILDSRNACEKSVQPIVADIIADIQSRGDKAVLELTEKFDKISYDKNSMKVSEQEINDAISSCPKEVTEALKLASKRIAAFHEKQLPKNIDYIDGDGVRLGMRWNPISDIGIYVPGGLASYPSSVLHNAIAAKVAGVTRIAMVVPTPKGEINPAILAAAKIAEVNEIYKIGGAQAIAALAYGTETIKPVHKIVGPGNAFVAEAKRQVFGKVGIDMIAGPSEILVVADSNNNPEWIAADILSQAEHDAMAQSILITDSEEFATKVHKAIAKILNDMPRKNIAEQALNNHGCTIIVETLDKENINSVAEIINLIAPEHLELALSPNIYEQLLKMINNAGAIFLGRHTPEAIGDYVAGPSHVLPTSQTAKFSSGLSVYDFIKKSSIIGCSDKSFTTLGKATVTLASSEGLHAHALSAELRLQKD